MELQLSLSPPSSPSFSLRCHSWNPDWGIRSSRRPEAWQGVVEGPRCPPVVSCLQRWGLGQGAQAILTFLALLPLPTHSSEGLPLGGDSSLAMGCAEGKIKIGWSYPWGGGTEGCRKEGSSAVQAAGFTWSGNAKASQAPVRSWLGLRAREGRREGGRERPGAEWQDG